MRYIKAFLAFWYDFIVGDDWVAAAGVVLGLAITAALAHSGVNAWWLLPLLIAVVFAISLRRAVARSRPGHEGAAK
ncbi:hypothetical protein [Nocardia sp. NPDC020380]|uniref:hypothetical protein n=1 Tax=Nocardia sp. NPDC020380 TaxID=3364309 RepID=UPI00378D4551